MIALSGRGSISTAWELVSPRLFKRGPLYHKSKEIQRMICVHVANVWGRGNRREEGMGGWIGGKRGWEGG